MNIRALLVASTVFCAGPAMAADLTPAPVEPAAPAPVYLPFSWTGFYIGVNVGGQFGHSEDNDIDFYWTHGNGDAQKWGYNESGFVGGGQVGYNFQWNWLVLGIEADAGYMNLNGSGKEPWSGDVSEGGPNIGSSDSDFFTTIRGRLGFAFGHWLFYGTGGGQVGDTAPTW